MAAIAAVFTNSKCEQGFEKLFGAARCPCWMAFRQPSPSRPVSIEQAVFIGCGARACIGDEFFNELLKMRAGSGCNFLGHREDGVGARSRPGARSRRSGDQPAAPFGKDFGRRPHNVFHNAKPARDF